MAKQKPPDEGMYLSDKCQFCHGYGEKAEPYLCPRCKERIEKLGYIRKQEAE